MIDARKSNVKVVKKKKFSSSIFPSENFSKVPISSCFFQNDAVIFEVKVIADEPYGVSRKRKRPSGYMGLENQGPFSSMDPLLQVILKGQCPEIFHLRFQYLSTVPS